MTNEELVEILGDADVRPGPDGLRNGDGTAWEATDGLEAVRVRHDEPEARGDDGEPWEGTVVQEIGGQGARAVYDGANGEWAVYDWDR